VAFIATFFIGMNSLNESLGTWVLSRTAQFAWCSVIKR
jgi:hypothetical protein